MKQKAAAYLAAAGLVVAIVCAIPFAMVGGSGLLAWMLIGLTLGLIATIGVWACGMTDPDSFIA